MAPLLALSLAAQADPAAHDQTAHLPYDPRAGVDADGRIAKPAIPEDLPNPERWRYTPPGRIKPGSPLERLLVSSFALPILFSAQDVGFGGGIALTDVDFRNQQYREFAALRLTYSEEGQQAYRIDWSRWLEHRQTVDGGIWREERGRVFLRAGFEKTLTRRFFGFGSRTPSDAETSYTEELAILGLGARRSWPDPGSDWFWRVDAQVEHHTLAHGHVRSVPSTDQVFPDVVADGDGDDLLWIDAQAAWDTRDSLHQPYRGSRVGLDVDLAPLQSGGEHGGVLTLDAQHVVPLPPLLHRGGDGAEENPPTDVLAVAAFVQDTVGDLPFYALPTLGGGRTLRGFVENRFTDRAAMHASIEYRLCLVPRGVTFSDTIRIERFALALFYEGGTVADGIEHLRDGRYRDSVGAGLRFGFSREATFRADLGFGDDGSNFTLAFGNAF